MQLSKNFTLNEMIESATATKYKVNNTPDESSLKNLKKLCTEILQPIREAYGKPIKVNSAYRCKKLNALVGGAVNSDHMYGAAADIRDLSGNNKKLFDLILSMIKAKKISCRQLIWEYGTKTNPRWIHIAINHSKNSIKNNKIIYLYK